MRPEERDAARKAALVLIGNEELAGMVTARIAAAITSLCDVVLAFVPPSDVTAPAFATMDRDGADHILTTQYDHADCSEIGVVRFNGLENIRALGLYLVAYADEHADAAKEQGQ